MRRRSEWSLGKIGSGSDDILAREAHGDEETSISKEKETINS